MAFKRKILAFTSLSGLVIFLAYFFLVREQEEPTLQNQAEIAGRTIKDTAPADIASSPFQKDLVEKVEDEEGESIEELVRRAVNHPDPGERIGAVLELSQRESVKPSIGTLVTILHHDKDEQVREAALDALDELQGLSFDVLAKVALHDPAPSLRIGAIELLGEIDKKDRRTTDLLKRVASTDRDGEVRDSAKELLEEEGKF